MFHAHIISFVPCFICILLHLFTFSWTNLLTRGPVPVSYFCCFSFQKTYTGNILGIARDKKPRQNILRVIGIKTCNKGFRCKGVGQNPLILASDFWWNNDRVLRVFIWGGIYGQKADPGRGLWAPHHLPARRGWDPCRQVVWGLHGPPSSLLRSPCTWRENIDVGFCPVLFREYFLCRYSETKKAENRKLALGIFLIG